MKRRKSKRKPRGRIVVKTKGVPPIVIPLPKVDDYSDVVASLIVAPPNADPVEAPLDRGTLYKFASAFLKVIWGVR